MATVPNQTLEQFKQKYPNVPEETIREAALSAGVVNGGIAQVRGLVVRNILEKKATWAKPMCASSSRTITLWVSFASITTKRSIIRGVLVMGGQK